MKINKALVATSIIAAISLAIYVKVISSSADKNLATVEEIELELERAKEESTKLKKRLDYCLLERDMIYNTFLKCSKAYDRCKELKKGTR